MPDALELMKAPPRNIVRKVLLGLVLLSFLMFIGVLQRPQAPALDADCAKASFVLQVDEVKQNKPVTFTVVGPEGRTYALGLDTSTFLRDPDGTWRGVPRTGAEETFLVAGAPEPMPAGCQRLGYFSTPVPLGTHTVTLYELTDRGAVFVQQRDLEVVEP